MKQILPPNRGVDAVVYIGDKALGGQKDATITRRMTPINITNKITGEWVDSLAGTKSWTVTCSGMFIKDDTSFETLTEAFNNGTTVTIKVTDKNKSYAGKALITNFPVSANYNDTFTYNLTFTGVGELI